MKVRILLSICWLKSSESLICVLQTNYICSLPPLYLLMQGGYIFDFNRVK
jgi:hypothetical protein